MYLWKIKSLAKELSLSQVSEITGMRYFLTSVLLTLSTNYYALWFGVIRDWLFFLEVAALFIITIIGCISAFEANGGNKGREFILRAVCLTVPISIRIIVFSAIFSLIMYFGGEAVFSSTAFADPLQAYSYIRYLSYVGFNIYFWWLLIHGLKSIRYYEKTT